MTLSQISRRQFILLTLQLLAAFQLPACSAKRPTLGKDPLGKPLLVEDHSQVLAHWAEKGIRDSVLINIDTHDDIRWIQDQKIDALRDIYRHKEWQRFKAADSLADDALYNIGNWIYAGSRLGIFREVYWVMPFDLFSNGDPESNMRRFLKSSHFSDQEIQTFSLSNGRFHGSFHGIPLTICNMKSLPDISSPLLLSVDTDFFPPYSNQQEKSYLTAMHEVFQALYAKKYRILDAVVSYSVNGDYLRPYLRWVGDTIAMLLENPALLNAQPPQMQLLVQELDNLYRDTDTAAMLKLIDTWHTGQLTAPALQAYEALAAVLHGDSERAFAAAVEGSRMDKRYSTLFPYIGTYYFSKGYYSVAERFYLAGFHADPAMANGLFQYAHCLRRTGRVKEALAWYEKDQARNGIFPTRFLIAEMQMLLGDRQAAAVSVAKAVESLMGNRYAEVENSETAEAIYRALSFCDREGKKDLSTALRSNPTVVDMFKAYPEKSKR